MTIVIIHNNRNTFTYLLVFPTTKTTIMSCLLSHRNRFKSERSVQFWGDARVATSARLLLCVSPIAVISRYCASGGKGEEKGAKSAVRQHQVGFKREHS
ncbi:unnamed protein product [Caenorhabditis nigoni]